MSKNKKSLLKGALALVFVLAFVFANISFSNHAVFAQGAANPPAPNTPTAPANNNPAPTDTNPDTADSANGANGDSGDEDVTCSIEKLGWLLCPVIETAGRIGDKAFQFLSTTFLETEPELVSNDETGTKYAWELARNLANIMFIIAFLIIIYSQVTGAGINNYGIKKMMPRLIVAALAVNVSYYICQLMVDLSNVMGYEIQNFMNTTAKEISDRAAMPPAGSLILGDSSPGVLEEIVMAVLAGAAVVWMLLPFIFVGVGTIVITCIIILVILLLRKAFIVLLIVASPIAFVLYLLPNTEKYFQKWLSMFWKLLMVFPVIGILMGGGQLASAIILVAGSNGTESIYSTKTDEEKCIELPRYGSAQRSGTGNSQQNDTSNEDAVRTGPCDSNSSTPLLLGLVAAGIAVAPLLAVFSVLKGALNAAGAIGGKIAGAVDTYTRKGADWGTKNTAIGRGMAARKAIKQNYKDQRFADRMSQSGRRGRLTRVAARGITGNAGLAADKLTGIMPDEGALGKAKQGVNFATGSLQAQSTKLSANFAGAAAKIEEQDTKDQEALLNSMLRNTRGQGGTDEDKLAQRLEQAIINGDKAGAKAATNLLAARGQGGTKALAGTIERVQGVGGATMAEFRSHISNNMNQLKGSDADIYAWAGDASGRSFADISGDAATYDKLTNDQLATQTARSLSGGGAAASIGKQQTIVDQQGNSHVVTRGQAILSSKAGSEIKGENRGHFG